MLDIRAHTDVSSNYPACPSWVHIFQVGHRKPDSYKVMNDGTLRKAEGEDDSILGSWWPHSATCVEIQITGTKVFFQYRGSRAWASSDTSKLMMWNRKCVLESSSRTPVTRVLSSLRRPVSASESLTNVSRFRMTVLPTDPLDSIHRAQLHCMGLRVCRHLEVGRVLVTSRGFGSGEAVLFSRVKCFNVESDSQVLDLIDESHPSCCYLLIPRTRKLYYNKGMFCPNDPIGSGDIWYLVNHSNRANVEVILRKDGIQFKAKRAIQPNEPLVWTYPPCFFGKEGASVDLPQSVLPDESVIVRE